MALQMFIMAAELWQSCIWIMAELFFIKPHAMQQDRIFLNTYQWFCETLGLEVRSVHMLIRKNYAWVEEIKYAECQSTEEIQLFYKRLGVWMFCCYILSVGDMHYENMIASGAYPMIIDMETVPGIILLGKYRYCAKVWTLDGCEGLHHQY